MKQEIKASPIIDEGLRIISKYPYDEIKKLVSGLLFFLGDNAENEADKELFDSLEFIYNVAVNPYNIE